MSQKPHSNFKMKEVFGRDMEVVDEILAAKEEHINRIQIPKKDGSPRHVISPSKELKYIQRSLYWRFFRRYKPHEAAHGFVAKRGISTNADFHVGASAVGKIDIKTFFDSISIDHLKNCLFGNKHICRFCRFTSGCWRGVVIPLCMRTRLRISSIAAKRSRLCISHSTAPRQGTSPCSFGLSKRVRTMGSRLKDSQHLPFWPTSLCAVSTSQCPRTVRKTTWPTPGMLTTLPSVARS